MRTVRRMMIIFLVLMAGKAAAQENVISLRLGAYDFTDSIAHSIYNAGAMVSVDYERFINEKFSLGASVNYMNAEAMDPYFINDIYYYSFLGKGRVYLTPDKRFSPYIETGVGYLWSFTDTEFQSDPYKDYAVIYEASLGISVDLYKDLYLEGQSRYSTAYILNEVSTRDMNIGGIMTGIGLAWRF